MLNIKDANGNWIVVREEDIYQSLSGSSFKILGMNLDTLIEIERIYVEKGGPLPMTPESVRGCLCR